MDYCMFVCDSVAFTVWGASECVTNLSMMRVDCVCVCTLSLALFRHRYSAHSSAPDMTHIRKFSEIHSCTVFKMYCRYTRIFIQYYHRTCLARANKQILNYFPSTNQTIQWFMASENQERQLSVYWRTRRMRDWCFSPYGYVCDKTSMEACYNEAGVSTFLICEFMGSIWLNECHLSNGELLCRAVPCHAMPCWWWCCVLRFYVSPQ